MRKISQLGKQSDGKSARQSKKAQDDALELSNTFVEAAPTGVGRDTETWLQTLSDESMMQWKQNHVLPGQLKQRRHKDMILWVEKLFDLLQVYAATFNRSNVARGLAISSERPDKVSRSIKSKDGTYVNHEIFSGRISTRTWACVVCGYSERIDCFMLPASQLLSFHGREHVFDPYLRLTPVHTDGEPQYSINGEVIDLESMPFVAKALFSGLITATLEDSQTLPVTDPTIPIQHAADNSTRQIDPVLRANGSAQFLDDFLLDGRSSNSAFESHPTHLRLEKLSARQASVKRSDLSCDNQLDSDTLHFSDNCDDFLEQVNEQLSALSKAGQSAFTSRQYKFIEAAARLSSDLTALSLLLKKVASDWRQFESPEVRRKLEEQDTGD